MTRTPAVMEIELKSCPFCGGEAEHQLIKSSNSEPPYVERFGVRCRNTRCLAASTLFLTRDEAIAAWNNRTPAEPLADGEMIETASLHIVFDGPPSAESGRFVECETPDGKSVKAGEWHERADGFWELRIAAYNPNDRLTARPDLTPETLVFAVEAAEQLELRGRQAQGMLSAIPAIVADERLEQHNAIYESEAKRWFRLTAAVRAVIDEARNPNDRLREALEAIKSGAALGKQMFEARVHERKDRLTWYAVNVLQDNLDACFGTADAALSHKD